MGVDKIAVSFAGILSCATSTVGGGGVKRARSIVAAVSSAALALSGSFSAAQTLPTYFPIISSMTGNNLAGTGVAVTLGGYNQIADGGGGSFAVTAGGTCTANGGTVFTDAVPQCYTRVNPTNNVREWGAYCDVAAFSTSATATATWEPTLHDPNMATGHTNFYGALVVTKTMLFPGTGPAPPPPMAGEYVAISQVGVPTLWAATKPADPVMWATRFSTLSSAGMNYLPGDLVSFAGSPHAGQFSQQVAIVVDSVKTVGGASGVIDKWHFAWGGLYDQTVNVQGTLSSDPTRSKLQGSGSGAVLTPAWSGWSVLNNQPLTSSGGMAYHVGDTITLSATSPTGSATSDGSVVNQKQFPELVVEATDNSGGAGVGAVTQYDWLNYGSYSTLPTTPNPLTLKSYYASASGGTGFELDSVQWTQAPLSSMIDYVLIDPNPAFYDIFLSENFSAGTGGTPANAFPANMPIHYFYYGHDDGNRINVALGSQNQTSIATGDGAAFSLPAACGTTQAISLPQDTSGNRVNPSLVGGNFQSTGLYAFAAPLASRGTTPVLSRMIYSGPANAVGGGFRDMMIQAMGVPEGYGYYGMATGVPAATGYVGPSMSTSTPFPAAGDAVEIDSGASMRIENVHITNGGIGSGNALVQCGIDDANSGNTVLNAAFSKILFADSRIDGQGLYPNTDVSLRLADSCRGSVFRALSVYDGTKADVLEYNANVFSQLHFDSGAANASSSLDHSLVFTTANSGFAGIADYGVFAIGNPFMEQTQCDIANLACVYVSSPTSAVLAHAGPGQISDTQMKCGTLPSTPPNYNGIEVGPGVTNLAVGGTASSGRCNVPPAQLVVLDGGVDQTVSLCNNSNASLVYCAGYRPQSGFAAGRFYTQPSLGYTTATGVMLSGAPSGSPTTLYAIPFINPTGGTIGTIGLQVTMGGGAGSMCDLGIYASVNGLPGSLLLDSGAFGVSAAIMKTNPASFTFAPNTLYFLAVGCNASPSVMGTVGPNGLAGLLLGEPDYTTYGATNIAATWPSPGFVANGLPSTFPAIATRASTATPNIQVGP